ncbi:hypothetical protein JCM14076_19160 [Methylosoma difficile]
MNRLVWLLLCCLFSTSIIAKPLAKEAVPEPLKPWIAWVSEDIPELACPFSYNSFDSKRCVWPTSLNLALTPKQGQFSGSWQVYEESWVSLPGYTNLWPQHVTVNKQSTLVLDRSGVPSIKLPVGSYDISGDWSWSAIPDNLTIPPDTGLVSLNVNGTDIAMPNIQDGQLWLKASETGGQKADSAEDSLALQVFRLISDDIPLQVQTRLVLDVSGERREIKLGKPLLDGFVALSLTSELPAKLEADGQLLVQVRPGHWQIDILSRSTGDISQLPLGSPAKDWPDTEIWLFDARPDLRVVEVAQLDAVDTSQTNVPPEWRHFPAYRIANGQTMAFKLIRRGDPEPNANDLTIKRTLWLDFDGTGYTANDTISGQMSRDWRLNALAATRVGKVELDGTNQLVTQQVSDGKQGVEVRQGWLILKADSLIVGPISQMSAVGWEQSFRDVRAELNLPPGWRLLAASGVDNVPDSWVARWTLLDLFLVLCAALATGKLWNAYWGGFALVVLVLIWHEPDAPHLIWLAILAATALVSVLPAGKVMKAVNYFRYGCWLVLLFLALPFMVDQVRMGIYPQLEKPYRPEMSQQYPASAPVALQEQALNSLGGIDEQRVLDMQAKMQPMFKKSPMRSQAYEYKREFDRSEGRIDPKAKVQTGPGLPQWHWHKVLLSWNGPVDASQTLRLLYLSPAVNQLLNSVRVLGIAVLALLMFGQADKLLPPRMRLKSILPVCLLGLLMYAGLPKDVYADYPSDELLTQLQNRLKAVDKPDCLPACADIADMSLDIDDKLLEIGLDINAQVSVALPVPGDYSQWFPNQVLDNGKLASGLYRENNQLWLNVAAGSHHLQLRGVTPPLGKFSLPLPLKPKHVSVQASGWEILGIQENGLADEQLQFTRTNTASNKALPALQQGALPAFFQVRRVLTLGLDWRVTTTVTRLSPADTSAVLSVPLLPGEAVTTAGMHVKDGKVEVNFPSGEQGGAVEWQSTLEKSDQIVLTAPQTDQWIEVWQADISPIWHLEASGIAMIHLDFTDEVQWLPEWRPWPGETVNLNISRPEAVAGQTLTIDNSQLTVNPGQRIRNVELSFSLRSSQGGQHTIRLPEQASLQSVLVNRQSQPIRLQDNKLVLPINPGKQEFSVSWQEPMPIGFLTTTPKVDLGVASVNAHIDVNLGADRWLLFVAGPLLGPAVLFWGVLVVVLLLSVGLAKIPLTPLKTRHWFLLLAGLSQVDLALAAIVVVWLVLLGWRAQQTVAIGYFNAKQVLLVGVTLLALAVLFYAVAQGLLFAPDMRVTGNQSSAFNLNWYQDRTAAELPTASVVSVPLLAYRLLMLAWSLWLAVTLLNWLKWGWQCFSAGGLWQKKAIKDKKENIPPVPENKDAG